MVELAATNISDASVDINTDIQTVNETITIPLVTGMINIAQQKMADDIVAWANGGFKGQPLIISNPEKYIKDAGLTEAKLALKNIPTDSVYGDSIFASVVDQYKDSDLKAQLEELSKSTVPATIQENICDDGVLARKVDLSGDPQDGVYGS